MATLHPLRLVRRQIAWMITVAVVLVLFGELSVALFLTASLLGLLVLVESATPRYARPPWILGLRLFVAAGLVAFGIYVAIQIARLAPPGVL